MIVAFITLLERKILRFSQLRLGPNKPRVLGLMQPIADAIKLFSNKFIILNSSNNLYKFTPALALRLALLLWTPITHHPSGTSYEYGILIFLIILRLSIYPILLTGWRTKNKFTVIGRIRRIAQTISYEISLIFIILSFTTIYFITSPKQLLNAAHWRTTLSSPTILAIWLITILAETNRTPFDFAEGESELVSGFNTEYRANKFALIFITEYAIIYLFAYISQLIFSISLIIWIIFWIWTRATLPRHRYDLLININWKLILPISILIPCVRILSLFIYNKI